MVGADRLDLKTSGSKTTGVGLGCLAVSACAVVGIRYCLFQRLMSSSQFELIYYRILPPESSIKKFKPGVRGGEL